MWNNGMMAEHGWEGPWGWFMGLHYLVWILVLVLLVVGVVALVRLAWPDRPRRNEGPRDDTRDEHRRNTHRH